MDDILESAAPRLIGRRTNRPIGTVKRKKRKDRSGEPRPASAARATPAPTTAPTAPVPRTGAGAAPRGGGPSTPAGWRGWAVVALQIVLLAGVTVAAYYPAIKGGFIWDDDAYVELNPTLRTAQGLADMWTRPLTIPQYYPLVHTTFWVEYQFWKLSPLPYHLDNVLLHVGAALLLWLVLRRVGLRGAAYAAALLFAVHPVMVESAGWITERKNVLSLVFYLGAALAYLRFDPFDRDCDASYARSWPYYALAVALFLCALLCKTVTFSLPVVLLLVAWWKSGRKGAWTQLLTPLLLAPAILVLVLWTATGSFKGIPVTASLFEIFGAWSGTSTFPTWILPWAALLQAAILALFWFIRRSVPWGRVACLLPLLAVGGAFGLMTAWMEKHHVGAEGLAWNMNWVGHVLLAGRILWFYVGKLLWPAEIIFFYPRWSVDPSVWWQYLYPAAAAALVAALWLLRRRIGRGPLAAVLCFGVTIAPALGFLNVYPMRYSYVADHFQYHASLAIFALGAAIAGALVPALVARAVARVTTRVTTRAGASPPEASGGHSSAIIGAGLTLAAVVVLAALTWRQGYDYADRKTLWTNTIGKNPTCWIAYNNLGFILMGNSSDPRWLDGNVIPMYETAMRLYDVDNPNQMSEQPLWNLGVAYLRKGGTASIARNHPQAEENFRRADEYFRRAMAVKPTDAVMPNNFGQWFCDAGQPQMALPYFQKALAIDPNNGRAMDGIVHALAQRGMWAEALRQAKQALALDEKLPVSLRVAATVLATHPDANLRDGRLAVDCALRLCRLTNNSDPQALDALACAYAEAGDFPRAVGAARRAVDLAAKVGGPAADDVPRAHLLLFQAGKPYRQAPK